MLHLIGDALIDGTRDATRWLRRAQETSDSLTQNGLTELGVTLKTLSNIVGQRDGRTSPETDDALVTAWADLAFAALVADEQVRSDRSL